MPSAPLSRDWTLWRLSIVPIRKHLPTSEKNSSTLQSLYQLRLLSTDSRPRLLESGQKYSSWWVKIRWRLSRIPREFCSTTAREALSLGRPPARIPDLRRGSAEQRDDVVPRSEVQQADDGEQVPGVQAVRGRVEAAVDGLRSGPEQIREFRLRRVLRERLLQEASVMQGQEQPASARWRTVEWSF